MSFLLHELSSVKEDGFARFHYFWIWGIFTEVIPRFPLTIGFLAAGHSLLPRVGGPVRVAPTLHFFGG